MKKFFVLYLLLSIVCAQAAFAQGPKPKIVPKEDVVYEDSSEHHRIDKQFSLHAQLTGLGPMPGHSSGIAGYYFIDRNNLIGLDLLSGRPIYFDLTGSYDISLRSASVQYKRFFGNSFYVKGGLGVQEVDYKYNDQYSTFRSQFKSQSSYLEIAIGNQWQWEHFTLGCDWFGYAFNLGHNFSDEKIENASSLQTSWYEIDKEYAAEKSRGSLLRFYLGASF